MHIGEIISLVLLGISTITGTVVAIVSMIGRRFDKTEAVLKQVGDQAKADRDLLREENANQHAHVEKTLGELRDSVHDVETTVARWFLEHIERFHSKL